MKAIFINAIKGIELPEIFKNVQAEYYTEEEMREIPECADFVQYWAEKDEAEAENFCRENNFDFWY